jgi:hypothetical protein
LFLRHYKKFKTGILKYIGTGLDINLAKLY